MTAAHTSIAPTNAATALIALLGWPVRHSASPQFQNAALRAMGLNAMYMAFEVTPARFENAFRGLAALGAIGANVTIPHKEAAFALCDACTPEARLIEAVNTVTFADGRAHGANTDCHGIAAALAEEGVSFADATLVLLGAGGAARGILAQAILDGAARVVVVNRTLARAEALIARLLDNCRRLPDTEQPRTLPVCQALPLADLTAALPEADILINATAVGLRADDPPLFDAALLNPRTVVYDTIYNPPQTRLLIDAKRRGCATTANGLTMLLHQGARAFELWFQRPAPLELMRKELLHPRTTRPKR